MNSAPASHFQPFSATKQPSPERRKRSGSRAKLAKRFFEDTYAAWEEQGEPALARAAFHDPMGFVNMVARLMPQKIEVSTPTDGMTDERIEELMALAERMASFGADNRSQGALIDATAIEREPIDDEAHSLDGLNNHEKPPFSGDEARRGRGALVEKGGGGETPSYPQRAESGETTETEHNLLDVAPHSISAVAASSDPDTRRCLSCAAPLRPEEIEVCARCGASALPYPVGPAQPLDDKAAERLNLSKLDHVVEEYIDPASLF